eukprot:15478716-Alexandrium_andersonii.AAC.1
MSVIGSAGEARMLELIKGCLPSDTKDVALADACSQLLQLQGSKLHQFVGIASQKLLHEVLKVVQSLQAGRTPAWPSITSDFMAEMKLLVGFFCKWPAANNTEAPNASATVVKKGRAAMVEIYKATKTKAASSKLSFQDLEPLRLYPWLLEGAETSDADGWLASMISD